MKILLLLFIISTSSFAEDRPLRKAAINFGKGQPKMSELKDVVINAVKAGYYFAALPWAKEYIANRGQVTPALNRAIEEIIDYAGVKPFQVLEIDILRNSRSSSIYYVISKKYFARGKFAFAMKYLKKIDPNSKVYPYASHMMATIHSIENRQELASQVFKDCIRYSDSLASEEKNKVKMKQLLMNRDYCIVGEARTQFARRAFAKADLAYLDVDKRSQVWPEILFEEAWNSYYLGNYNRTLGKLVTYKAPALNHFFKPESEVLVALSYLKLCLYADAKDTVDSFYDLYLKPARGLKKLLKARRRYSYYSKLALDSENRKSDSGLLSRVVNSITMEQAYKEIKEGLRLAEDEMRKVNAIPGNSRFKRGMRNNLIEVINSQKIILGSYVRNRAIAKYAELYRAFKDMSYIKLEVLAQRKKALYRTEKNFVRKRGDLKYIERNEKQYFWNFNGEFWADELGDYVFALASRCNE